MSRLIDLALLSAVALLGWWLIRTRPESETEPLTTTVQVLGDVPLGGLGLLLVPDDAATAAAMAADTDDDVAPHQISPWQANRRTQILVPAPGPYLVRWGLQEQTPPRRALDVMQRLTPGEKLEDQRIEIPEGATARDVFEVELPAAHAAGLRRLASSDT